MVAAVKKPDGSSVLAPAGMDRLAWALGYVERLRWSRQVDRADLDAIAAALREVADEQAAERESAWWFGVLIGAACAAWALVTLAGLVWWLL